MCAKLVLKQSKYSSSRKALIDLHWLPNQARVEFKVLPLMHQCTHGCGPEYLKDLLTKRTVVRNLRNTEDCLYVIPFNKHKTFGDRSFSHCGPCLWNNLPSNIKGIQEYSNFKKKCKTHLFKKYFVDI